VLFVVSSKVTEPFGGSTVADVCEETCGFVEVVGLEVNITVNLEHEK
jgi:hypothetical protein